MCLCVSVSSILCVYTSTLTRSRRHEHARTHRAGQIKVTERGTYTFYSISDDGSRVIVDNLLVVDYDGLHGMETWKEGTADLSAGYHRVTVDFFESGGQEGIKIKYAGIVEFKMYEYAHRGLIQKGWKPDATCNEKECLVECVCIQIMS